MHKFVIRLKFLFTLIFIVASTSVSAVDFPHLGAVVESHWGDSPSPVKVCNDLFKAAIDESPVPDSSGCKSTVYNEFYSYVFFTFVDSYGKRHKKGLELSYPNNWLCDHADTYNITSCEMHWVVVVPVCSLGQKYDLTKEQCVNAKCPKPYQFSGDGASCEAYCATSDTWNPLSEHCVPPPQEQNCKTQGKSPIDFIEGRKYRSEPVLSSGVRYPFSLIYYFNNQRNQEKSPVGSPVAVVTGDRYLAATKPPMTASEYQSSYTNRGVPVDSAVYRASQHYGSVDQYWRHNFDDVLLVQVGQYRYQSAKGEEIVFGGLGNSAAYPYLVLAALTSSEETFAGYKLTNRQSREVRKFDENGRLIKLERSPQDVLVLTYDSQNRLDRITNSEGAYVQLAYQDLATNSVYSIDPTVHSYPVSASNNRSESSQITWGKSYQGKTATFHLITQITEASSGAAQSARTFEYNDTQWPASITDQYFVADTSNGANKKQLLHFEYDELGRAIFSGLEGRPSDTVNYVDADTRVVTNALGKQATYTFADFDGVKRLQSVTGEPTQNCLSSEVIYEYDANGNVSCKTQNGQVTEYQYDSQNREISRTEAAGTPEARTTTTEYHPTLNKPVRLIEPGVIVELIYDSEGLLTTKKITNSQQHVR